MHHIEKLMILTVVFWRFSFVMIVGKMSLRGEVISVKIGVILYLNSGKSSSVVLGESCGVAAVCVIMGGDD